MRDVTSPTRIFCHIFRRVPSSLKEQARKKEMQVVKILKNCVLCAGTYREDQTAEHFKNHKSKESKNDKR
jgi:hypothetical protein